MSSKLRTVRIDLSQDLPLRARPLAAETVARLKLSAAELLHDCP